MKRKWILLSIIVLVLFQSCATFSPNYAGYSAQSKATLKLIIDRYFTNTVFEENIEEICKDNDYVVRYFEDQQRAEIFPKVNPLDISPLGAMALVIQGAKVYQIEFYKTLTIGHNETSRNFHGAEIEYNNKTIRVGNLSSEILNGYDLESIKIIFSDDVIDFLYKNWDDGKAYITYIGRTKITEGLDRRSKGLLEIIKLLERNQELKAW